MNKSFDVFLIHKRGTMFKYLFLLSVALYFLLPVANAQEVETKVLQHGTGNLYAGQGRTHDAIRQC